MNQPIVAYLKENKDAYSQADLVVALKQAGHTEADIAEAVAQVYNPVARSVTETEPAFQAPEVLTPEQEATVKRACRIVFWMSIFSLFGLYPLYFFIAPLQGILAYLVDETFSWILHFLFWSVFSPVFLIPANIIWVRFFYVKKFDSIPGARQRILETLRIAYRRVVLLFLLLLLLFFGACLFVLSGGRLF